ncbi:YjbH domain-containing protein [Falsiroseomonas oryzae]|uniref:YjbH domain-containing protein n=1 Tax=Falsiroseomonas oryzae TaxID=2766473 RepID=UPI0022EB0936|nr:YjbH domain-containing protein [Roseomonas sp. MO-31]
MPGTGSIYGGVGLLEMRNARFRPDGTIEAGTALRHQRRFWFLSFQALPWLETSYRLTERLNGTTGEGMTSDRAFDVKIRLLQESDWLPAVAIGLQDFIGTGIYSGEYVVASKRFGPLDATLGLGWGRLSTYDDMRNPLIALSPSFENRPREVDQGGSINTFSFFRGESAGVFGGLEYSVPEFWTPLGTVEGLRAKVEFSADALRDERGGWPANTTNLRGLAQSRVNYGLQWSNGSLDLGAGWLYGTDFVVRLSARLDPSNPPEVEQPPPPALTARPVVAPPDPERAAMTALREAGFRPVAVRIEGAQVRIAVAGGRQRTLAAAAGRVMRAVQPHLPREVERIVLSWRQAGAEIARLALPRAAMEAAVRGQGSAEEIFYAAELGPAGADAFGRMNGGVGVTWGIEPRLQTLFGDPTRTLRWQVAAVAGARLELGEGASLAGSVAQRLAGNLGGAPPSDSLLPHVRSDVARYAREGETSVPALYAERIWTPGRDIFARITGGWLEPMFAGVSAEVLWRPYDRPFAIGADIAQVVQREYDGGLGTLGYNVTTGQVSLYADLPWFGTYAVLRAGRYLAGDWGGTIELGRRFASGIEVGGFATFTDVPFSTFGEGSFDRGIYVRVPLDLFGIATRNVATALIRGVQRDGGQRLQVDNGLWEITRDGRARAFEEGFRGFLR